MGTTQSSRRSWEKVWSLRPLQEQNTDGTQPFVSMSKLQLINTEGSRSPEGWKGRGSTKNRVEIGKRDRSAAGHGTL